MLCICGARRPGLNSLKSSQPLRLLVVALGQKFLKVGTGGGDVPPELRGGNFGIFCLTGFEKYAMGLASLMEFTGEDKMEPRVAVTVGIESLDE